MGRLPIPFRIIHSLISHRRCPSKFRLQPFSVAGSLQKQLIAYQVYYTPALSPLCRVWEISYRFMLCAGRPASLLLDKNPLDIVQEGATRAFMPYHRTMDEGGCATFRFSLSD